jgi:ATP-binding cassette subfamily B (MDR/TAP) protein 1
VIRWILRYLKASSDISFRFRKSNLKLNGYMDTDLTGDIYSKKSTIGFIYTLGNTTICWALKLQKIVSLSITEAEYIVVTEAGKEMV